MVVKSTRHAHESSRWRQERARGDGKKEKTNTKTEIRKIESEKENQISNPEILKMSEKPKAKYTIMA